MTDAMFLERLKVIRSEHEANVARSRGRASRYHMLVDELREIAGDRFEAGIPQVESYPVAGIQHRPLLVAPKFNGPHDLAKQLIDALVAEYVNTWGIEAEYVNTWGIE